VTAHRFEKLLRVENVRGANPCGGTQTNNGGDFECHRSDACLVVALVKVIHGYRMLAVLGETA